jgi:hypothetical protein
MECHSVISEPSTQNTSFTFQHTALVRKDFERHIAEHIVHEVYRNGLHGHWRCAKPNTGIYSFCVTTWPGYLAYTGDMGDYVFSRTYDMLTWMSDACRAPAYASEKCVAANHNGIYQYCDEIFQEQLDQRLAELEEWSASTGKQVPPDTLDAINEVRGAASDGEHFALHAMYMSGLWDEIPSCRTFTFHFLWCLHAIDWFCQKLTDGDIVMESKDA